ncbi:hypothetical protein ACFLRA_01325 [Bdellovibrionota bacterium]
MNFLTILVSLSMILLFTPSIAHAYLDPGTGSMILQIILGGIAGLAVALKFYWHKIRKIFGIRKPESEKSDS